jgi:SAM-dependent methyltransferase
VTLRQERDDAPGSVNGHGQLHPSTTTAPDKPERGAKRRSYDCYVAVTGHIDLRDLVADVADRERAGRTEADVQSGIKVLLLAAPLDLHETELAVLLEAQAGKGRRIDVEVGSTAIEVKKDLRVGNVLTLAVEQLAGYVRQREDTVAHRYAGILTDGADWHLYHLDADELVLVSSFSVDPSSPDVDGLVLWLEGVLATTERIRPTPKEIERRLGARSSGHALDSMDLAALYERHREDPTVKLKRELWGRLLTTALGTNFEDSDELFINHTLLVLSAECIAHAVIGWDLTDQRLTPATICSGELFAQAQIFNVVEADFFDWPIEVEGGDRFIKLLAQRLARFAWNEVEHDVMKVLYESVIAAEQRHSLGEYYTPDWLAERVVDAVVTEPLDQTVLDAACGSGTFLFHAVRGYLAAAEAAGVARIDALAGACTHVSGIDVHPVAVSFARVTYLLAMGDIGERPPLTIPVYLGDSVQWNQEENLLTADALTIDTSSSPATLFADPLRFPRQLLDDPGKFDRLVSDMADRAAQRKTTKRPSLTATFKRYEVAPEHQPVLLETFRTMCDLHDTGRDHIWGYFTRNLARPVWHARPENRVDVLVGNPPWLSYRFMPADMQATFRKMTSERGMWAGASVATHQDLSALFVARAAELYLRPGGRFGFVMPLATLTRRQFEGFRKAEFRTPLSKTVLAFDIPWDLHQVKPSIFPVPPSVIFGTRARNPKPLVEHGVPWAGRVPKHNASWAEAAAGITVGDVTAATADTARSPYAERFTQGATVVPRMLFVVEDAAASPLGAGPGRRNVQSWRSANEKQPWKSLPPLSGAVETQFIFPMHLGETMLPFRLQRPWEVVIPWNGERLLEPDDDELDEYPGLAEWWRAAVELWNRNRTSERLSLIGQLDYMRKFRVQFPVPAHRVVYTKGGMYLAAARVDDPRVIIDHKLYWASVDSVDEGRYLTALFNSDSFTLAIRRYQARGEHNPRDFDKYVFRVPFPLFDPQHPVHAEVIAVAAQAEAVIESLEFPPQSFQANRRWVRKALADAGLAKQLDELVAAVLEEGKAKDAQ